MRTGDTVRHKPTDERWIVACVNEDELVPCGWPLSYAKTSDCELVNAATDEVRADLLHRLAAMNDQSDPRCRYATHVIAQKKID